jgi:hypothetical protein
VPMRWYWLLTKYGAFGLEVFVEKMSSGEVIVPIFASAGGAAGYLSESADPWKPRKTSRGELVSLLMGACKDARWVALDPPPGTAIEERVKEIRVSSRAAFLEPLLGRGRPWFEAASSEGGDWRRSPEKFDPMSTRRNRANSAPPPSRLSALGQLAHSSLSRGTGTVSTGARR